MYTMGLNIHPIPSFPLNTSTSQPHVLSPYNNPRSLFRDTHVLMGMESFTELLETYR